MNELTKILGNLFILIFITITLFLLGLKNINEIVINIIIFLLAAMFLYLFFQFKKKYTEYNYYVEVDECKKYKIKKRLMYIKKIKTIFFYTLFLLVVISFWLGNGGNIWLKESVQFFKKRFTNQYLLNMAIFLFPLLYWISIESIIRNLFLYLQKKYKLDEIDN